MSAYKAIAWINSNLVSDYQFIREKFEKDTILIIGDGKRHITIEDFILPHDLATQIDSSTKFIFISHGGVAGEEGNYHCSYVIAKSNSTEKKTITDDEMYSAILSGIRGIWLNETGPNLHMFSCYGGMSATNKQSKLYQAIKANAPIGTTIYIHAGDESIILGRIHDTISTLASSNTSSMQDRVDLFKTLLLKVPADITMIQMSHAPEEMSVVQSILPNDLLSFDHRAHHKQVVRQLNILAEQYSCAPLTMGLETSNHDYYLALSKYNRSLKQEQIQEILAIATKHDFSPEEIYEIITNLLNSIRVSYEYHIYTKEFHFLWNEALKIVVDYTNPADFFCKKIGELINYFNFLNPEAFADLICKILSEVIEGKDRSDTLYERVLILIDIISSNYDKMPAQAPSLVGRSLTLALDLVATRDQDKTFESATILVNKILHIYSRAPVQTQPFFKKTVNLLFLSHSESNVPQDALNKLVLNNKKFWENNPEILFSILGDIDTEDSKIAFNVVRYLLVSLDTSSQKVATSVINTAIRIALKLDFTPDQTLANILDLTEIIYIYRLRLGSYTSDALLELNGEALKIIFNSDIDSENLLKHIITFVKWEYLFKVNVNVEDYDKTITEKIVRELTIKATKIISSLVLDEKEPISDIVSLINVIICCTSFLNSAYQILEIVIREAIQIIETNPTSEKTEDMLAGIIKGVKESKILKFKVANDLLSSNDLLVYLLEQLMSNEVCRDAIKKSTIYYDEYHHEIFHEAELKANGKKTYFEISKDLQRAYQEKADDFIDFLINAALEKILDPEFRSITSLNRISALINMVYEYLGHIPKNVISGLENIIDNYAKYLTSANPDSHELSTESREVTIIVMRLQKKLGNDETFKLLASLTYNNPDCNTSYLLPNELEIIQKINIACDQVKMEDLHNHALPVLSDPLEPQIHAMGVIEEI